MTAPDTSNRLFELAASFVNHTGKHIFLTGKAGTGKTTFLKYIKESCPKNIVVTAPTGVAAINAGGVTLHSFFQLPFGPFLPSQRSLFGGPQSTNKHSMLQKIRFNRDKIALLNDLELLVIDEISMVRADMLDAVDLILRHFRKNPLVPFGGVQVLYIGDLFQLPPVVVNSEWDILKEFYRSPFFFDAEVIKTAPPAILELQKIYRQSEGDFIRILNNIRTNQVTEADLQLLHECYRPDFHPSNEENYVTLTSHNYQADEINQRKLEELPGKLRRFEAETQGTFDERSYPADKTLLLKEGAQVMFIKNDKGEFRRYYNGKIGKVSRIDSEGVFISFPDEDEELQLEIESWKNIRYKHNETSGTIEEEELGEFKQFPIRLAWAITIHKSQGLTFEKAIVDAGRSFASGQVYVALSRLTSMEGLVLRSRISPQSIHCSPEVIEFTAKRETAETLENALPDEQKNYIIGRLKQCFDWNRLIFQLQQYIEDNDDRISPDKDSAAGLSHKIYDQIRGLQETAGKFEKQLNKILAAPVLRQYEELNSRVQAASAYFIKELKEKAVDALIQHKKSLEGKSRVKQYLRALNSLQLVFEHKIKQLEQASLLAEGLLKGAAGNTLLQILEKKKFTVETEKVVPLKKERREIGSSQRLSLQLFKEGKSAAEIASERGLAVTTIESHLAGFVKVGELTVTELVTDEDKIGAILEIIPQMENYNLSPMREKLGKNYSYLEIKAVLCHYQWLQENNS